MTTASIAICLFVGTVMLIASTIPGRNEPWSHRLVQLVFGISLFAVALHIGGFI